MMKADKGMTVDQNMLPLPAQDFRQAMRQWATGVTVVTARHAGQRHGMTVSSFTSVSLSPPSVLICLENGTHTSSLVDASGFFGVVILDETQQEVSDRFAGRLTENQDRFQGLETYTLSSGVDLLVRGLAGFDCQVIATQQVGDHRIYVGNVLAVRVGHEGNPLIYFDRAYRSLGL